MGDFFQIAIDGPAGSGKSTVARLVADRLGWLYVYTGAMYRAAALLAKRAEVDWSDAQEIARLIESSKIQMKNPDVNQRDSRQTTLLLNGEDVSEKIMTEEIGEGASVVAVHKEVREALVAKQQEIAEDHNVVMEGRDTTFRVLPNANLKIYLIAQIEERARRRHKQILDRGEDTSYDQVLEDLRKRDKRDSGRQVDPLQVTADSWVLDTTDLTIEQVIEKIVEKVGVICSDRR